ncbi:MAG: MBL fold metallo-hydrolase [bacterium]
MIIKLYGTRGSIAVANKETKKYGGNTTCLYVESNSGDVIVVDAGTGIRLLGVHLIQEKKSRINILFTHYHWDHIQGFPFFTPIFLPSSVIDIYGSSKMTDPKKALSYQMTRPYFPAILSELPSKITFKTLKNKLTIGDIEIQTIINNHPDQALGLKFTEGKNSFAFLTDNELFDKNGNTPYKKFVDFIKGVNFFIHDAQYKDDIYKKRLGWGHSTYSQVMKLAEDAGVRNVMFTHHDHGSNDKGIDAIVKGYRGKYPEYNIQAAADGKTIILK